MSFVLISRHAFRIQLILQSNLKGFQTIKFENMNYLHTTIDDGIQAKIANNKIKNGTERLVELYMNQLRFNKYSSRTIKSYASHLKQFLKFQNTASQTNLSEAFIENYLHTKYIEKKWSVSTQQQALNAIQYYAVNILNHPLNFSSIRPKSNVKLPEILSGNELNQILNGIKNTKHRCMIWLLYSAGLRLSELINLKLSDIKFNLNRILIRNFNGKQHYSVLSHNIHELLKQYIYDYDISDWLFEGRNGKPCTGRSVEAMFKKFLSKLPIRKHITIQTLRHCFAVHLLEQGLSLPELQALMGHQNKKTTSIYLHLARKSNYKIASPLDHFQSISSLTKPI